jgi:fluoroacetyl-CoA thioesterase
MKGQCKAGDIKIFKKEVTGSDLAKFSSGEVHPVYSTFAMGRDMEWASRLFIFEIAEDDEEGIGTSLHIDHLSPACEGESIEITATVKSFVGHHLICTIEVRAVND